MGRLAWIEDDAAGIRVPGWQNQLENMPEEATSSYATLNMYILDDVDPNAGDAQQGNAAQIKHAQFCNNMRDIFNNTLADFTVHSVRMQIGQQATHLLDYIEAEMENKTGDDLVVLCYQGKSGGDDDDYHFLPAGPGPRAVNAHDLISKVNQSDADCLFLLDCFFPDQTIKHWKRKDHMTEIIIAGAEMRDSNNGRTNTGAQSFAEGFFDGMRQIRAAPGRLLRPSIPMIMLHKTSLCSKPIRYWLNTPNRKRPDRRVWRFFIDIRRLKMGDGDKLQVRRCEVTGRRRGEFGGDPALENDGWGSDHESDDGGSDGGGDGGGDGDSDGGSDNEARHEGGGNDGEEDGDSSNGGWGRGFRRTRRRTPSRRQNAEDDDGAGVEDEDKGSGNGNGNADSVAKLYARIKRKLGLPSKLTDGEAINLFKRLDGLPKHLERRERLGDQTQQQLPTPSSGGIRKRARGKRAVSTEAGERGRSGVAARLRRASPVTSDCEITSVRRFGHESENPIDLSEATETVEGSAPASARRVRVTNWIQDLFKEEYDDDDKPFIKLSDSPVPRAGGDGAGAALRETLMDLDFEITSEGPVNRAFGRGALIDLTGTAIDLTNDSDSLFIPE